MKLHSPIRHLHDFDDVETDAPTFYMAAAREGFRCIADVLLLEGRHRFLRFSIATVCAALDLDEYQRLSIFHDEVNREIFDVEIRVIFEALLIERVQHRMAGAVSGSTGALRWRARIAA